MIASILRNHSLLTAIVIGLWATTSYEQEELGRPSAVTDSPTSTVVLADKKNDVAKAPQIEVCFVLDTTGSMGGLIQGAKDKIWSIANELAMSNPTPELQFGLIGYRDRGDEYITKVTDLTEDLDTLHTKLMAFTANGGGDGPESVNQSLHEAVTKITWSRDDTVLKIIFLVGDAPPHMDYDEVQYPEICKLAMDKDLVINTIQCGNMGSTTPIWRDIAARAEGQFTAILQNGGTVAIATPQDKKIAELNIKLNRTVVSYGSEADHQRNASNILTNEASEAESIADRANFYSLSRGSGPGMGGMGRAGKVIGGQNDLVEKIMNKEIEFSEVDSSKLPKEIQAMPADKRQTAIEQKIADRKKLQAEMDALVKERSDFIKAEKSKLAADGEGDGFDMKVKKMIREQGESKGIKFSK